MTDKYASTSLQPDDLDPTVDERGNMPVGTPEGRDTAYQALVDDGLSPQEASEAVDYMAPLSEEEAEIMDEYPLDGLAFVDDADRQQTLRNLAAEGTHAIDRAKEDAIYGEDNMNNEEKLERNDSDSGWGFSSIKRGIKRGVRGVKRGAGRGLRGAGRLATKPLGMVAKKFMPNRDRQKAALVKNTFNKLWFEHANWLAKQDQAAGRPLQPRSQYEATAKNWARSQLAAQKLPLKYTVGRYEIMGAAIMGADVMGVWWNPFTWFQSQVNVVLNNTASERDPSAPEGEVAQTPQDMDPGAVQDDGSDQTYADESQGWNGVRSLKGHDVLGADSLGAFTAHVLGLPRPAKDNPSVDRIVSAAVAKLRAGQAIGPGDLALLCSAAREGNERAQKLVVALKDRGAVVAGDEVGLDPWMHKLNPAYWLRSKTSQSMKDREVKEWKDNADLQKQLKKQREDLDQAERARTAADAVALARQQSAATDAQLKAIESSLKGEVSGSFVGHEKVTPISDVVVAALDKAGRRESAGKILAKIKRGESLSPAEVAEGRKIAKIIGRMRVVHGDLVDSHEGTRQAQDAIVGACSLGNAAEAIAANLRQQQAADRFARKLASGQPLSAEDRRALAQVIRGQKQIRDFTKTLVSGSAFAGCSNRKNLTRAAVAGAARSMSENDRKMVGAIAKLAKLGNPRARKALAALKRTGDVVGGDVLGLSLKSAFKYATAPVWLPAAGVYKGAKWTGKKLGILKGGKSAEQARLDRMRAAYKRRQAAEARARAADSQNESEQRAQQAIASAADAEADAADAEAASKEAAQQTKEFEANPDMIPGEGESSDASGAFVGEWEEFVGAEKEKKVLKVAASTGPAGTKVRSAAAVYVAAKRGDRRARKAIVAMVARAKSGDQQALRDVDAMKAASIAYRAKHKALKKQERSRRADARRKSVVAFQRRVEAKAANKLAEGSRRRELRKLSTVESRASRGDKKAAAFVAKRVADSKRGDKRARAQVQAMRLARQVRASTQTRREKKNLRQAQKIVLRARRGDPRARRQIQVVQAAARQGNPNARRAEKRLKLAAAVTATVTTGTVVVLASKKKSKKAPAAAQKKATVRQVALAKQRAASGSASREELVAGARAAHSVGDRESAAQLASAASRAPSATEGIKQEATRLAAARQGSQEASSELMSSLSAAKEGDPEAVKKMGRVAAAQTVASVERGEPVAPAMRDAVNLQERARAGDPAARETLKNVSEAASEPGASSDATAAAVYAAGAGTLLAAVASKPRAKTELMAKVNPPVPAAEKNASEAALAEAVSKANAGTITADEGARAADLAMRLGKPRVAADLSAKSPPLEYRTDAMSTLPDQPLPPVAGVTGVLKAALRALSFSTPDPIANYREGLQSRSSATSASGSEVGWSPFRLFAGLKKAAPYAALTSPIAAAASVANLVKGRKTTAPAPAAAAAPAPAPAAAPSAPSAPSAKEEDVSGSDDFKEIVASALRAKKISRRDLDRAVDANPASRANPTAKKALAEQVKRFLEERKVVVSGDESGLRTAVAAAARSKTMTRDDFNRAVTSHCRSNATTEQKRAFGARLLAALGKRGVAVK